MLTFETKGDLSLDKKFRLSDTGNTISTIPKYN